MKNWTSQQFTFWGIVVVCASLLLMVAMLVLGGSCDCYQPKWCGDRDKGGGEP